MLNKGGGAGTIVVGAVGGPNRWPWSSISCITFFWRWGSTPTIKVWGIGITPFIIINWIDPTARRGWYPWLPMSSTALPNKNFAQVGNAPWVCCPRPTPGLNKKRVRRTHRVEGRRLHQKSPIAGCNKANERCPCWANPQYASDTMLFQGAVDWYLPHSISYKANC